MKKIMCICLLLIGCGDLLAIPDVQFSPAGTNPGRWAYDGQGTFSFQQSINAVLVFDGTSDQLTGKSIYIPDLTISNNSGQWSVIPNEPFQIKDGSNVLLSGTLRTGNMFIFYSTGIFYADIAVDISDLTVNNTVGSAALDKFSQYGQLDFNLTLQSNINFDYMVNNGIADSDGFSGSITAIPEPCTLALVSLGGLLLSRRKN